MYICVYLCAYGAPGFGKSLCICKTPLKNSLCGASQSIPHTCVGKKGLNAHIYVCTKSYGAFQIHFYIGTSQSTQGLYEALLVFTKPLGALQSTPYISKKKDWNVCMYMCMKPLGALEGLPPHLQSRQEICRFPLCRGFTKCPRHICRKKTNIYIYLYEAPRGFGKTLCTGASYTHTCTHFNLFYYWHYLPLRYFRQQICSSNLPVATNSIYTQRLLWWTTAVLRIQWRQSTLIYIC